MDELHEVKQVELFWLGQMGLLIKCGDQSVCVDYFASPVDGRLVPPPVPASELKGISAFLGTHDHIDHIDHDAWKIWAETNPDAKFVFPRKHMDAVLADGVDPQNAVGLNDGESVQIGAFKISAIAASHEFLDRDPSTGLYPYLQYVIEVNGKVIHHAGDTVRYEGMLGKIKQFGHIDVQLLPINGRDSMRYRQNWIGNMTYQEAADLAGDTGSSMVIPGHWDMFAINSSDPNEFADYIDAKYGGRLRCRVPKVMEKIILL